MEWIGYVCFGLVVGWVTYRTLRRNSAAVGISDIASVVAAIGGGAVTNWINDDSFPYYAMGLAIGFFGYLVVGLMLEGKESVVGWMRAPAGDDV